MHKKAASLLWDFQADLGKSAGKPRSPQTTLSTFHSFLFSSFLIPDMLMIELLNISSNRD